jgi:mono/diheme cytochrome c family protein
MRAAWHILRVTGTAVSLYSLMHTASAETLLTPGTDPERLYNSTCAFCHSRPRPPFPAPELRGRNLELATVKHFVRQGPGAMPPFSTSNISDEALIRLSAWLAASPAPPKPALPPMPQAQGAKP